MRRKKQKTRKIVSSLIIILLLAAAGFCVYKFFFENQKEEKKTETQTQTVVPTEEKDPNKPEEISPELTKKPVQKYEGEDPNENETLTGVITYAGATSNNVIVRVNIDQYIDGGSCVLKLIKNDSVEYEETSNLIADVSTSTCEGFNIVRTNLSDGNYTIRIELSSNGKTGSISGELNI